MVSVEVMGQLIPGPAAAGVDCLPSNNNLDLCRHDGRLWLAWRTASTHFAAADARIEVSSAPGVEGPWRHETTVARGADVREPRFAVHEGRLHLFLMELGTDPKRFQPRRTHHLRRAAGHGGGTWTADVLPDSHGFVPWRVRRLHGRWAMLGYRGGESMYGPRPQDPAVQVRWSDDLDEWGPAVDVHPGGIECELVELGDGRLVGVTRNEGPVRFGGDVLVGPDAEHLWARPIRRKLDSPNLFLWAGEPWLIARRQVPFGGNYDLAPSWVPGMVRIRIDQGLTSVTRKRSALWRLDVERLDRDTAGRNGISPADRAVVHVADLPSRGDTSFAGVVVDDDDTLLVADYTTPSSRGDVMWIRGQLGPTVIQALRVRRHG